MCTGWLATAPESPILTSPSQSTKNNRWGTIGQSGEGSSTKATKLHEGKHLHYRQGPSCRSFRPAHVPILSKLSSAFREYAYYLESEAPMEGSRGRIR
jgi:hypothetical protein